MSWERSRYIPWSRISDVSDNGVGYESQKEKVYRSLQKEANKEKDISMATTTAATTQKIIGDSTTFVPPEVLAQQQLQKKKKGLFHSGIDYSTPDLVRSLAFGMFKYTLLLHYYIFSKFIIFFLLLIFCFAKGGCIGAITGTVFGFMDGMRSAQENPIIKNASNMAKSKYLFEGTTRSGMIFGAFFSGFHCLKYGIRVAADPGLVYEAFGASVISLGALVVKPTTRPSIPYAAMLIGMDCFSIYMKEGG